MIVDAHVHIFPAVRGLLNGKETRSLSFGKVKVGNDFQRWFPPTFVDSSSPTELLIEHMNSSNVSKAIVTQGPMYGFHKDYLIEAQEKYPDRIKILGLLERYDKRESLDAATNLAHSGFCGLKIELETIISNLPQFKLDGPEMMSIYELCQTSGLCLMVHPIRGEGTEVAIANIARAFPRLLVIIAHLGLAPNPGWESKICLAKRDNVFIETSGLPALFVDDEYPYLHAQRCIRWALDEVGSEKILWGSDYPGLLKWCTYTQTIDVVRRSMVLSDLEKERILGTNAERVFALD